MDLRLLVSYRSVVANTVLRLVILRRAYYHCGHRQPAWLTYRLAETDAGDPALTAARERDKQFAWETNVHCLHHAHFRLIRDVRQL